MPSDVLSTRMWALATDLPDPQLRVLCERLAGLDTDASSATIAGSLGFLPVPGLVDEARELAIEWQSSWPGVPFAGLAVALEAIGRTNRNRSLREHVELVWTGPKPNLGVVRRTEQALTEVIDHAQWQLWLVSFAGYDVPRVAEALRRACDRDVNVSLVMESPEESDGKLTQSGLSAFPIDLLQRMSILVWPREKRREGVSGNLGLLHAKTALADREKLFVTSANLTGNAMHLNMELGLLVTGGRMPLVAGDLFEWLVSSEVWLEIPAVL